jgi:hypothetical protein
VGSDENFLRVLSDWNQRGGDARAVCVLFDGIRGGDPKPGDVDALWVYPSYPDLKLGLNRGVREFRARRCWAFFVGYGLVAETV